MPSNIGFGIYFRKALKGTSSRKKSIAQMKNAKKRAITNLNEPNGS